MAASIASINVASAELTVTREVLIERGNTIDPDAIAATPDGGVVVAGTLRRGMPWATRLAADGTVRWRYVKKSSGDLGGLRGVVGLDNNNTILCGFLPIDRGLAGFIADIDINGTPTHETVLYPNGDKKNNLSQLRECIGTEAGAIALGSAAVLQPDFSEHLWIVFLDRQGNVLTDKVLDGLKPAKRGAFIQRGNLFLASYGPRDKITSAPVSTDVMKISENGTLVSRVSVPGDYALAKPTGTTNGRVVLVPERRFKKQLDDILVLDENLREVGKSSGQAEMIQPTETYRLTDDSIVFFGSLQRPGRDGSREESVAAAALTNGALNQTQIKTLETFFYSGRVSSAASTGAASEFVVAREVFKIPSSLGAIFDPNLKGTFGVVVSHIVIH